MASYGRVCAAILFGCCALSSYAQQGAPAEDPADAWMTGPLLATNPKALPAGGLLIEPYLQWTHANGNYDAQGRRYGNGSMADAWNAMLPIYYGITDRLTGVAILNGEHLYGSSGSSDGMRLGDLDLRLSYMLVAGDPRAGVPTVALAVTQQLPSGSYDRLGANPANGVGSGVPSTQLALNTQTYFWMPNGHILRIRANFSWTFPNRRADVAGTSVYGTEPGYAGRVDTGQSQQVDIGAEYSINRNWALATDLVYAHGGSTWLRGAYAGDSGLSTSNTGSSESIEFAPAVEYNWTPKIGLIGGVQFTVHGRNVTSEVIPQVALNMVF